MATVKVQGGKKLDEALKKIAKALGNGSAKVRVGFLEKSTYPDGTPVAMVAAIQNYGAPKVGIPPRPFFSGMVAEKGPEWPKGVAKVLKSTDYNVEQTLAQTGSAIAGQVRQAIIDTNEPPLSPVTIMLRGMRSNDQSLVVTGKTVGEARQRVDAGKTNYGASSKVLVDSGHLVNSVDYEVKS